MAEFYNEEHNYFLITSKDLIEVWRGNAITMWHGQRVDPLPVKLMGGLHLKMKDPDDLEQVFCDIVATPIMHFLPLYNSLNSECYTKINNTQAPYQVPKSAKK